MEKLSEVIESKKYIYPQDYWQTLDNFIEINKIAEDNEDALNWYAKYVCDTKYYANPATFVNLYGSPIAIIDEMVNSSDFHMVIKKLNIEMNPDNRYPAIGRDKTEREFKQHERSVNTIKVPLPIFNLEKMIEVCDKFIWTVNSWEINGEGRFRAEGKPFEFREGTKVPYVKIRIEPIQSINCNDHIFKECNWVVYHLASKGRWNSIKRTGLRMKGKKNHYRVIENKVFFCSGVNKDILKKTIMMVAKSKGYWDNDNDKLKSDVVIIKVDVNKYNINFYEDTYYSEDCKAVYSYAFFPPNMLEEVKYDDLFKINNSK